MGSVGTVGAAAGMGRVYNRGDGVAGYNRAYMNYKAAYQPHGTILATCPSDYCMSFCHHYRVECGKKHFLVYKVTFCPSRSAISYETVEGCRSLPVMLCVIASS